MRRALVLIAQGFEEIEAVTVIDVLRRAGVDVVVAGLTGPCEVVGSRNIRIVADVGLDEIGSVPWDLVYLPGGSEGAMRLSSDPRVGDLLHEQRANDRMIAAICAASCALHAHGILAPDARLTSHPSVRPDLDGYDYREDRVVADGSVVTSRGAGTAMELALVLIERLADRGMRDAVRDAMLARAD